MAIDIIEPGSGYSSLDVHITGDGFGASATAILDPDLEALKK